MKQYSFTDCVEITGSSCGKYEGEKWYVSTGAVNVDRIENKNVEIVCYDEKPSRANLLAESGDVLFAKMQGTKKTLLIDKGLAQHVYSTGFCAVKPKPQILTERCLYHLLTSETFLKQKDKNCSGATQRAITRAGLEKILINVPEIADQDAISEQLDKLVLIINMCQEKLKAFDEITKVRFVELFGDIIHNDKQWPVFRFSDITSSRLGKMLDTKQQTGQRSFPYLANFNVQWFKFELGNLNQMDFSEAEQEEFKLEDGDLLVCEGGEIGRCAIWHNEIQPCYFQKALHRVRCNQQIILPDYLAWWFRYNCEHEGFSAIEGAKATIAHLPGAKLKVLPVVTPPIELQSQFAAFVRQVDRIKSMEQKRLEKLQILFDSLMQKYFG